MAAAAGGGQATARSATREAARAAKLVDTSAALGATVSKAANDIVEAVRTLEEDERERGDGEEETF